MNAALDALKVRFVARCAQDRERLREAIAEEDRPAIKHLSHTLAGAAGTFGFPALGEAAMAVEDCVDLAAPLDPGLLSVLDGRLAEVARP